MKCYFCKKEIKDKGNDCFPFETKQKCCDECNWSIILPTRMGLALKQKEKDNETN